MSAESRRGGEVERAHLDELDRRFGQSHSQGHAAHHKCHDERPASTDQTAAPPPCGNRP